MGSGIGRFASPLRKRRVGEPLSNASLESRSDSGSETAIAASTPDQQASDHPINRRLLKTRRFLFFRSMAPRRSAGFHTARQNFIGLNGPLLCAHDQDPEHERDFSHPERCAEGEGPILVSWEEEAGKAESEIAEATQNQPHPKKARDESRSVHEQPERDQPYAPEDC